jgi:uncharacterized protein YndB with AHSA1/START domain
VIPVSIDTYISAPREKVFDFVADIGARPAWNDHFQREFHLTRPFTTEVGSAARYRTGPPFQRQLYSDLAIVALDRPRRIVEEAHVGRRGRNRSVAVYEFEQESAALTHVELTTYSEPATVVDRIRQTGAAGWIKRNTKMALERLRLVFEEPPQGPLARASVAGYEPLKAPRFGAATGMDPARPPRPRAARRA